MIPKVTEISNKMERNGGIFSARKSNFGGKIANGRRAMHIYHILQIKNGQSACFFPRKSGIPLAIWAIFGGVTRAALQCGVESKKDDEP